MLSSKWNMCTICKQFVLLCISHAKNCTEDKCPVPVCAKIKKNLRDQRNQRNISQNRFMQHRMAAMARSASITAPSVNNSVASPAQNTSPGNPASQSPAKGSPATHPINPPNSNSPATKLGSPAGPRSVGKGGPKTPGDPKARMVASPAVSAVSQNPPGLTAQQTGKPEQLNSIQAPNVTLGAATGLPDELEIQRVHQNSTSQLTNALQGPPQQAMGGYMNRQPQGIPQEIMPHNPSTMAVGGSMSYNQHVGGVSIQPQPNPAMMQHIRMQQGGMTGYHQQPGPQVIRQQAQYHHPNVQYSRMQPPGAQMRIMGHPAQSQVYQHSPTLHQMLQAPQQQYSTQQAAYAPQMRAHQLGPPPQYPVSAMRHPSPQTAGYPQVLGAQTRPMPTHSPMPPQMHSQYLGAPPMGQNMSLDPSGMQTANPNFMYQQQYRLNSSNNNNNGIPQFSAMSPQERLSAFADNL